MAASFSTVGENVGLKRLSVNGTAEVPRVWQHGQSTHLARGGALAELSWRGVRRTCVYSRSRVQSALRSMASPAAAIAAHPRSSANEVFVI
jgi:hypothetical protein